MARAALIVVLLLSFIGIVSNRASNFGPGDSPKTEDEQSPLVALNSSTALNDSTFKAVEPSNSQCSKQTFYLDEDRKVVEITIKIGKSQNCQGKVVEREIKGIRGYHMLVVFSRFMADARHILVDDGTQLLAMNKYGCNNEACPLIPIPSVSNRVIITAHPIMGDQAINVDIVAYVIATSPAILTYTEGGLSSGLAVLLYVTIAIFSLIILMLCCCILHMKSTNTSHRWASTDNTALPNSAETMESRSLFTQSPSEQRKLTTVDRKFDSDPLYVTVDSKDAVRFLSST